MVVCKRNKLDYFNNLYITKEKNVRPFTLVSKGVNIEWKRLLFSCMTTVMNRVKFQAFSKDFDNASVKY